MQKLFRLEILLALYCGLSSILVLGATFIFVPTKKDLVKHVVGQNVTKDALLEERAEITLENSHMQKANDNCENDEYCGSDKSPALGKIAARDSLIGMKE